MTEALGATPEEWQAEELQALASGTERIAIKSGHGVGKSTLLSWIILWWITTRYPAKVACTAPTAHQLFDILWSEVANWLEHLPEEMRSQYIMTNDRITLEGDTNEKNIKKLKHFAVARTARKEQPEALQGFHAKFMLFIVEEGSGIDDKIFEVAEGALSTEGAYIVMAGNPTRTTGYFFEAFQDTTGYWRKRTVSCYDSKRVSQGYIERALAKYGEEDDRFRVRVLGEFPKQDADSFIKYYLVDESVDRDIKVDLKNRPIWGLDVARSGSNKSCLVERNGHVVTSITRWKYSDAMNVVGAVINRIEGINRSQWPKAIVVDVIGMGGPVADRLRELMVERRWKIEVIDLNVSESPTMEPEKYLKLRDELWGKGAEWFESRNCSIPDDPEFIRELTIVARKFTSSGKEQAESKDDIKRKLADSTRSPDSADAFMLTMAEDAIIGMGFTGDSWNRPLVQNYGQVA